MYADYVFARRGSHQQATQKLARNIAAYFHFVAAAIEAIALHDNRWKAFSPLIANLHAELSKRRDQIPNRPLAHPLDAVETIRSMTHRTHRGQEADGGP